MISHTAEWNVPDWRDTSAYPRPDDLGLVHWRWEFLRRRDDYRKEFDLHAAATYAYQCKRARHDDALPRVVPPHDPSFRIDLTYLTPLGITPNVVPPPIDDGTLEAKEALIKYLQADLKKVEQVNQVWRRCERYGFACGRMPNPRCPKPERLYFERSYGPCLLGPSEKVPVDLGTGQFAARLDTGKPLEPQLKTIIEFFLTMQTHSFGKKLEKRARKDKWPLYLRVLDARDQGQTHETIGRTLLNCCDQEQAISCALRARETALALSLDSPL